MWARACPLDAQLLGARADPILPRSAWRAAKQQPASAHRHRCHPSQPHINCAHCCDHQQPVPRHQATRALRRASPEPFVMNPIPGPFPRPRRTERTPVSPPAILGPTRNHTIAPDEVHLHKHARHGCPPHRLNETRTQTSKMVGKMQKPSHGSGSKTHPPPQLQASGCSSSFLPWMLFGWNLGEKAPVRGGLKTGPNRAPSKWFQQPAPSPKTTKRPKTPLLNEVSC